MIMHHADVVTNSYCIEWAHKKMLEVPTNTQRNIKLFFKILGSSQQPRISLKREALKELNILAKRGDLEEALL